MAKVNFDNSVYRVDSTTVDNIDYTITNEFIGYNIPNGSVFIIYQSSRYERIIYSTQTIEELTYSGAIELVLSSITGSIFKGIKQNTKFLVSTGFELVIAKNQDNTANIKINIVGSNKIIMNTTEPYFYVLSLIDESDDQRIVSSPNSLLGNNTDTAQDPISLTPDEVKTMLDFQETYQSDLSDTLQSQGVGGIDAGTTVADLEALSLTFSTFVDMLVFPTVLASISSQESVTLTENAATTVEVGTSISPTLTATFNQGHILNGDGSTGPNLVGLPNTYTFSGLGLATNVVISSTTLTESTIVPSVQVPLGSYTWAVDVAYNAGTGLYYDNKGNIGTYLDGDRIAGISTDVSSSVTGKYYAFYGTGSIPTDSATVRALPNTTFLTTSNTGSFTLTIIAGQTQLAFAVPAGKTATVLFRESSNADVTGSFTKSTFNVNDAGGNPVSYDVYTSTLSGSGYASNSNYDITIS